MARKLSVVPGLINPRPCRLEGEPGAERVTITQLRNRRNIRDRKATYVPSVQSGFNIVPLACVNHAEENSA